MIIRLVLYNHQKGNKAQIKPGPTRAGGNAMTKSITTNATDLMLTKLPKGFNPVNAPKPNAVAVACAKIGSIAASAVPAEGLTPFGHRANCKGGVIDMTILSGKVHSIESFIDDLINSGLKVVNDDRKDYGNDTLRAVLAKRVTDHISWCATTSNNSHGGFGSRLAKVGLDTQRTEMAALLNELDELLKKQFSKNYAPLYKARKK